MPETDTWVKDQLISQAVTQTEIIGKLDDGARRMDELHDSLNTVIDATVGFDAVKIDVNQLKKAEELRLKEERLKVTQELESFKEKQAMWRGRFWELFVKALPFILVAIMFLYSQIKDQL